MSKKIRCPKCKAIHLNDKIFDIQVDDYFYGNCQNCGTRLRVHRSHIFSQKLMEDDDWFKDFMNRISHKGN